MRPPRKAVLAGLAAAVVTAGVAWACTQQPVLVLVSGPSAVQPTARVAAEGFAPGIPVQVRWGDQAGQVVAAPEGPSFAVDVQIPTSAPGVYYLVATQQDAQGSLIAKSGVAVKVPAAAAAGIGAGTAASDAWAGFAPGVPSPAGDIGGPESSRRLPAPGIGAALVSAGLVSLVAAGALTGVSRRRQGSHR